MPTTKASTTIPALPRALLLYLEPLFALAGVLLALTNPSQYVSTMTRDALPAAQPNTHFIYTQLAGGWLHFVFTEAVILRCVDDVRVWRLLCTGMILSDLLYLHSTAEAVGGWVEYVKVGEWTGADWTVAATTLPFVLTRAAIAGGAWGGAKGMLVKGE